jgi:hypothetical protein
MFLLPNGNFWINILGVLLFKERLLTPLSARLFAIRTLIQCSGSVGSISYPFVRALISTALWRLYDIFICEEWRYIYNVNVPSKSNKQRSLGKNSKPLEGHWRKEQDPDPDPIVRGTYKSADLDTYQNVTESEQCFNFSLTPVVIKIIPDSSFPALTPWTLYCVCRQKKWITGLFFNYSLCTRRDQSQPAVYDAAGRCETPLPATARHDTSG